MGTQAELEEDICRRLGIKSSDFDKMRPVARRYHLGTKTESPLESDEERAQRQRDQRPTIGGFRVR